MKLKLNKMKLNYIKEDLKMQDKLINFIIFVGVPINTLYVVYEVFSKVN
jgi:hypothetical protein